MAREKFTYADFAEGYRDFEEVVVNGYIQAHAAFQALGYVYLNLDPKLSPVEETNCVYLMQRASGMLFGVGWASARGEEVLRGLITQAAAVVGYWHHSEVPTGARHDCSRRRTRRSAETTDSAQSDSMRPSRTTQRASVIRLREQSSPGSWPSPLRHQRRNAARGGRRHACFAIPR
jgi:hypothetical protein